FLQKFTSDGYRLWGTFYGGEGFDVGMEVCTDIFNNIIFTGFTQSRNSMASQGAYKDTLSGIWDAFVGKFDRFGKRLWGTYYGGNSEDNGWGIGSDGNGDIYVTGHTASYEGISTPGAHKRYLTNDELDAFVVKFNKNGIPQWGTYYGGEGEEYGNCGAMDAWGHYIVSGNTLSDTGIVTSDAPQTSRSSQRDAFLAKFNSNGQRLFGTYYGGVGNDYGHGVVVDKEGRLLMTGYTFSTNLTTSLDAQQPSFGGGTDAYVFKLGDAMSLDSIFTADFTDSLCADNDILIPFTVNKEFATGNVFIAHLSDMKGMFREYYNIGSLNSRSSGTITGRIPREVLSGNKYRIRVIGTSPEVLGDDNGLDITIFELPKAEISGPEKVCEFQEARYRTIQAGDLYYKWTVTGGIIISSSVMSEVDVLWGESANASLKVVVTNSITGCVDSAEYMVTVYPALKASNINGAESVCPNNEMTYYSTREEGIENKWEVAGGRIVGDSTDDNVVVYWEEAKFDGTKTGLIRLIQVVGSTGCRDTSEKVIYKRDLPKPFIAGDSVSASNSVKIYRTVSSSKYSYLWTVEGGIVESGGSSNQCYVRWLSAGKGRICLHLKDRETDCEDSVKLDVVIRDDAATVISGSKRVCANTSVEYTVSDTLYTYIWRVSGGELSKNSDSTGKKIMVKWLSDGNAKQGCLFLFRQNKSNGLRDTLVLDIEIMATPVFTLKGNDLVCEGVTQIYRSDRVSNSINSWNVSNGIIFGDATADSIIVFWERDENDNSAFRTGQVDLTKTDTTSFCSTLKSLEVRINKTEKADFAGDTVACENELKVYKSKSSNKNLIYNWHIAGGIIVDNSGDTNIIVKWGKQGKGYVQIVSIGANGCSDSLMRTVTVNKSPEKPIITQSGRTLISSADEGNQWYIGGEIIVGATAKEYTPDKSGLFTVQVSNTKGCISEMSSPFNFDISLVNGNFPQNDIVFFPNPVDDILTININLLNYSRIEIELCDLLGNILYSGSFNQENISIDMSRYSNGVYVLRCESSGIRIYKVLIKSE
ncbi:T9SS C-terminal target domain-containing protein, partial [Bacteroidetes/Chlorobi group bacterium ChocPot_Mid]